MTTKAQQIALDNALVAPENQRIIGKCNMRINPRTKPNEPTYQVVLDVLAITTCYPAFLITAEIPVIYMHQFWATVNKHKASYRFKVDNKRFSVNVEVFREILNICPKSPEFKYITDVIVDHLHQPWRTFASIINKCLSGKLSRTITTKAQQIVLDNALVAPENQRVIGKYNMRINPGMKPKEPTYQVVLDALSLATCYPAFLITAEVPVIYMHHFWATVNKHKASYQFKVDNKRFSMNVEVFREILNICPKIPGQEFDEPPSEEEALSFIQEIGHSGEIKYITDVIVDHLHQPWRTFASIINKFLSRKDLAYHIDNKDSKKQDKMLYPRFTKIIIHHFLTKDKSILMRNIMFMHTGRDDRLLVEPPKTKKTQKKSDSAILSEETPSKKKPNKAKKDVPLTKKPATKPKLTKKKALVKAARGKCLNVLSKVALSEAAQLKEGDRGEEDDADYAKEENEEELDDTEELYKDVNVNLRKEDVEMTDADQGGADQQNVSQESGSSVSSHFTEKLLNFENVSPADNEIASLMDTTILHEEPSSHTSSFYTVPVMITTSTTNKEKSFNKPLSHIFQNVEKKLLLGKSLEAAVLEKSSSQPKSTYEAAASLSEFELTKILMDKMEEHKSYLRADYKRELYDALVKSYNTDKDLFDTYGEVFTLKRSQDDKDKDQDPSDGSDRGMKRRKSSKYAESSRDPKSKESKSTSSSKGTSRSQHKSSGKFAHPEEQSHTVNDSGVQQNQEFDTGNNDEQPDDKARFHRQHVNFRPSQTWISNISRAEEPRTSFDKLMDTLIEFSAFVMNRLNITQTWISNISRAEEPRTSFDKLMDTPIEFSAFVMNWLNITNLT
ncbi:hypothetical protein Tco_0921980 [Tanacetum coccineum]|uniref:Uncharacterized protein n=1 Tax=Tanacetum coccineum TaxID=301880 RepID=A0ABQ5D061_9ASTR